MLIVSISLCMIVKDEEDHLASCIESVKDAVDEIIIVDTGSADSTKEIAKKYTDKIFDFTGDGDSSTARNFSISKASKQWILVLDADESMDEQEMEVLKLLLEDSDADAFSLIQRNYTNDSTRPKWMPLPEQRSDKENKGYKGFIRNPDTRLFRNNKNIKFSGAVHETVDESIRSLGLKKAFSELSIHHYYEEKKDPGQKERQLEYLGIIEKKIEKEPTGKLYYEAAAICLNSTKDYKRAINYFELAIKSGYREYKCLEGIAHCYIGLNEHEKAFIIYKKLVAKKHITPALANNLANLLAYYKHYEPAIKMLNISLKLGNPNKERILSNIRNLEEISKKKTA